jgi:hypothetical protein
MLTSLTGNSAGTACSNLAGKDKSEEIDDRFGSLICLWRKPAVIAVFEATVGMVFSLDS